MYLLSYHQSHVKILRGKKTKELIYLALEFDILEASSEFTRWLDWPVL